MLIVPTADLRPHPIHLLTGTVGVPIPVRLGDAQIPMTDTRYNFSFFISCVILVQQAIDTRVVQDIGNTNDPIFELWVKFGDTTFWLPNSNTGISVYRHAMRKIVNIQKIG